MTDRKNLKIDVEMYDRLKDERTQYETWNQLFDRLLADDVDTDAVGASHTVTLEASERRAIAEEVAKKLRK